MSCIVTKLKGATGNTYLPLFDALNITIPASLGSTAYFRFASEKADKCVITFPDGVTISGCTSGG